MLPRSAEQADADERLGKDRQNEERRREIEIGRQELAETRRQKEADEILARLEAMTPEERAQFMESIRAANAERARLDAENRITARESLKAVINMGQNDLLQPEQAAKHRVEARDRSRCSHQCRAQSHSCLAGCFGEYRCQDECASASRECDQACTE